MKTKKTKLYIINTIHVSNGNEYITTPKVFSDGNAALNCLDETIDKISDKWDEKYGVNQYFYDITDAYFSIWREGCFGEEHTTVQFHVAELQESKED